MRDVASGVGMPTDAIHWHDGLLLEPIHFEQLCARQEELLAYQLRAVAPFAWGVARLAVRILNENEKLLVLDAIEAIMPDGLFVTYASRDAQPELALALMQGKQAPAIGQSIKVYLAVSAPGSQSGSRFERYLPADAEGIERVRPALRLVTAEELKLGRDVALPLLELKYSNGSFDFGAFQPPLLDIGVAPVASGRKSLRARATELCGSLGEIAMELGGGARRENNLELRAKQRDRLRSVAACVPPLSGLLSSAQVAPFQLYQCLCQAVGHLCMLGDDWQADALSVPPYQHSDPEATFDALFDAVGRRLKTVCQRFTTLTFERGAVLGSVGFRLMLHPAWIAGWPVADQAPVLVLGLRGISASDAQRWMTQAVIASEQLLMQVRSKVTLGAARALIAADGRLQELRDGAPLAEAVFKGSFDAGAMQSDGTSLFAVSLDPQAALVHAGQALVLEWAGLPMPAEVVLFVPKAEAPAAPVKGSAA